MRVINTNLRNKGIILPLVLFLITLLTWLFSIVLLIYKNEIDENQSYRKTNNDYWKIENFSKIAEYEIFKGEISIRNNEYKDIIEYFEDKDLVWLDSDKLSKSGFKRYKLIHNGKTISDKIQLSSFGENIFEIKLLKNINTTNESFQLFVNLYYVYSIGEKDFFKSSKREIKGVEINLKNENIRN
ncbi:MAG: hypothetical protein ACRC5W_00135 [Cetobacterium sp.]|uniref:hypothetical protein n=1 Tax=Cetobacterium sp. TaxID=2071632 RepID=UPI003F36B311